MAGAPLFRAQLDRLLNQGRAHAPAAGITRDRQGIHGRPAPRPRHPEPTSAGGLLAAGQRAGNLSLALGHQQPARPGSFLQVQELGNGQGVGGCRHTPPVVGMGGHQQAADPAMIGSTGQAHLETRTHGQVPVHPRAAGYVLHGQKA